MLEAEKKLQRVKSDQIEKTLRLECELASQKNAKQKAEKKLGRAESECEECEFELEDCERKPE